MVKIGFLVVVCLLPFALAGSITGTVFEDVNYGGGAGRTLAASSGVGRPGVRVELYSSTGTFLRSETTNASGVYTFGDSTPAADTSLPGAPTVYVVRVVNNTVASSRTGACTTPVDTTTCTQIAVQTFRAEAPSANSTGTVTATGVVDRVGGEDPSKVDAAANTTSATLASLTTTTTAAQSISSVRLRSNASIVNSVNFGFNFDTIVSIRDAGQGSLRQFILNSNALTGNASLAQAGSSINTRGVTSALPAGKESSIFMISNGTVRPGLLASVPSQLTGGVAVVQVATILPAISDADTILDGGTQTFNIANSNTATLGEGGSVGTTTGYLVNQLNGPEVHLEPTTASTLATGLVISGANTTIQNIAIKGFGITGTDSDILVNAITATNTTIIRWNVIGTSATSFTQPTSPTVRYGVYSNEEGLQILENLVGFVGMGGLELFNTTSATLVEANEVRNSGRINSKAENINLGSGSSATVRGNLLTDSGGPGIDTVSSTGSNIIEYNTIRNNGRNIMTPTDTDPQNSGIRLNGSNNSIRFNVITQSGGAGILVRYNVANTGNLITQNSIYANGTIGTTPTGQIGIDLVENATLSGNTGGTANFVTVNDATDGDTGPNNLMNFPVLESVAIEANSLVITGFARPGARLEFFIADNDPSGFGEGQTYLFTSTEGCTAVSATCAAADSDTSTGSYSNPYNALNQGADTTNRFSFTITKPASVSVATRITATATDASNNTSEFSGRVLVTTLQLTGSVFEDFNYGGGVGRAFNAAQGMSLRPGARVELYSAAGAFLAATLTNSSGLYSFDVVPNRTYTVRVVNSFVTSSRTGGCTPSTDTNTPPASCAQVPVQTFRTNGLTSNVGSADTARVGGENPALTDASANTTNAALNTLTTATQTPQSVSSVAVTTANVSGVNFGFNFDTIVSSRDTGQGSLRQFIINSNALGGEASLAQSGSRRDAGTTQALPTGQETSIFMIPNGAANPGLRAGLTNQLTGGVAVITVASTLEPLTGTNAPNTTIDGTTQTFNVRVSSGGAETNAGVLGSGGTVGVDALALSTVQRPEVQIVGSTSYLVGLDLQANNLTVRGIAIYGFGNSPNVDDHANIRIGNTYTNALIEQNILGTPASSFDGSSAASGSNPCGGSRSNADNIRSVGGDNGTVRNNLIGWATGKGFGVENSSQNWLIENNEFRCNAITNPYLDAIDLETSGTTGNTITRNLMWQNEGVGADMYQSNGSNAIVNNTIRQNGIGTPNETPGIRLYGSNNIVLKNIVQSNYGAGIMATCQVSCVATNTFTRNSIFDNGESVGKSGNAASNQIGIDLNSAADNEGQGVSPFVTKNESGDGDTGANELLNFPVFESAGISGANLILKGFARPGVVIEVFIANDDPSGFGEGETYRISLREGGTGAGTLVNGVNIDPVADADATTGTYNDTSTTGPGTDTTNRFEFTIPLPSGVSAGVRLTATATLLSGSSVTIGSVSYQTGTTSEFSNLIAVTQQVARLGVAKALDRIVHSNVATDNSYTLVYRLTVENFATSAFSNLELFDDVVTQFSGLTPTNFNTWLGDSANAALLSPAATLTRSGTWTGTATSNILTTGQSLAAGATGIVYISFDVTVNPAAASPNNTLRDNSATVRSGSVTDTSTKGTDPDGTNNDNNPSESTVTDAAFVKLLKEVRNCGSSLTACSGAYGTSATGKPGDYLEYRIRYYNISSQVISQLRVNDSLASATPFQEDTYAVISPNVADFNVTCPNSSTVDLDRSNAAITTTPAAGAITAFNMNIMAATACNLTQVTPGQQGQVLFKVRIP